MTDAYRTYQECLFQLQELIQSGIEDGEEYDAILDRMDFPWWEMTNEERTDAGNLAARMNLDPNLPCP